MTQKNSKKINIWVLINIFGVILYLCFASTGWAPPSDKGLLGGPGDAFIWGMTAFPLLAGCSLMNIFWLASILANFKKSWKILFIWIAVVLVWSGANRYDAYSQYDGSAVMDDSVGSEHSSTR